VKVLITPHHFDKGVYGTFEPLVDLFIVHRKGVNPFNKVKYLVQGCPCASEVPQNIARREFSLPSSGRIVSSFGFLMPWKGLPDVVEAFIPYLQGDSSLFLQLLHSIHEVEHNYGREAEKQILNTISAGGVEKQVFFSTAFLSTSEVNVRLQASDLGILCGDASTGSSSAVSKTFVSARLPIVASDINHYRDLSCGVVWVTPKVNTFVSSAVGLLRNSSRLKLLREEQKKNYEVYNWDTVAKEHVNLYVS